MKCLPWKHSPRVALAFPRNCQNWPFSMNMAPKKPCSIYMIWHLSLRTILQSYPTYHDTFLDKTIMIPELVLFYVLQPLLFIPHFSFYIVAQAFVAIATSSGACKRKTCKHCIYVWCQHFIFSSLHILLEQIYFILVFLLFFFIFSPSKYILQPYNVWRLQSSRLWSHWDSCLRFNKGRF